MKLIYTRNEINEINEMTQEIIVAITGSSLADKTIEEQVALSKGLMYFADNGDLVLEVPEEFVLKLLSVYRKHMPTIMGIVVTLKGIAMTFKAMAKALSKELDVLNVEFAETLERKAKFEAVKKKAAEDAMKAATEADKPADPQ
jgi:hypothetical protein